MFSVIIFFIIIALSYNGFKVLNSKTISEFFTFSADISIFAALIASVVSTVFGIFAAIVIFLIKDIFNILDEEIIIKLILLSISFLTSIFPFLVYTVYRKMKTNISIYNIMLAVIVLNMFFVRADYKSSIFTKALYIVLPIVAILFDILVLTSSLYRLTEYGITPNKITLVGTNLVMLGNLVFITFFNIKSILNIFKNNNEDIRDIKNITIGDSKSVFYIYVYVAWAFIVCFILPLFYNFFY